jgi:hypothetical protein
MRLNLPILDQLADSENILIAGAGGGFDVFSGLPLYFTLREMGKRVHLANYSFTELGLAKFVGEPDILLEDRVVGARGAVKYELPYYPEGYLSLWFKEVCGEDVTVWMFGHTGAAPLAEGYAALVKHLNIDALILMDGGVDSLMHGDEEGPGTLIEDSLTLTAVATVEIPVKILACIGFGTEVEEALCHHHALENIATLAKAGAFLGSCALTPQMPVFQQFEAACRYVWEQPKHPHSHISSRVIPAVYGEFGGHRMYPEDYSGVMLSPLMSLYWFFDARAVTERNLLVPHLGNTATTMDAFQVYIRFAKGMTLRPRKMLPY